MKSKVLMLLAILLLAGCANTRQVGQTKEASKAQQRSGEKVGRQFIGVR